MSKWHWWTRDDGTTGVYYNDPRYYYVDYFDPDEGKWTTKVIPGRPPEREIPELLRWKRSPRDEISDDINWNPDIPSDAPRPIPEPSPLPSHPNDGGSSVASAQGFNYMGNAVQRHDPSLPGFNFPLLPLLVANMGEYEEEA